MRPLSNSPLGSVLGLVLLASSSLGTAGCNKAVSHSHQPGSDEVRQFAGEYPIRVVCTIGQVTEMLKRLGGNHLEVAGMMGPGIDPHLYRIVPADIKKLSEADAIFYNGLHLEGRMTDTFVQMARRKPTFAVTEGLVDRVDKRLREPPEFAGMYDPHVWHDVALWSECVQDMAQALSKFDPKHTADYQKNAETYLAELTELHTFCQQEIAKIPADRRVLITAHDAFGYFGQAYGIEVFGLKGVSSEEEKDLAHQEEIQKMLIERQIPAIFVESAIAHRTVEALVEPCRAAGWDVKIGGELYADALGPAGSDASNYTGMIRENVRTIVGALGAE